MSWNNFLVLCPSLFFFGTITGNLDFITYVNNRMVPVRNDKCDLDYKLLDDGEVWYRTDFCEKIYCKLVDEFGLTEVKGCVPITPVPPNCTIVGRRGTYPDCCVGEVVCNLPSEPQSDEDILEEIQLLLAKRARK
uniref:Venom protein-7 n=1 Tax=Mesobuthus eupeus TaxID=34648 RepID=E4VP44_MESEU|nr:venom protein-7 [Mesobuthus eupeus]